MTNLKLNKLIADYAKIQEQEDLLKKEKESLKQSIIAEMGDTMKYDSGAHVATRALAEGFKYNDEVGMINKLKEFGYESFIKEKIDTTAANKFFKEHMESPLTETLITGNYLSKTLTEKLTIK